MIMPVLASVLSAVLFAAALFCFVRALPARWRQDRLPGNVSAFSARELGFVLLLCLGCLVLRMAAVSAARLLGGKNTALADTFRMYSGLDSKHYFEIAKNGYRTAEFGEYLNLVFFPGYPLLTGLFMLALPEMISGYLAAWLPFLAAGMALYRLFRLEEEPPAARRMLLWLCLFPGAVFYAYPMSESLYLAAAAAALYLARTRRWLAAGVCGFLAAFTRSLGALLVLPLGVELLEQFLPLRRENRKDFLRCGACLLLIPLAVLIYLWINRITAGDPLIFLQYQKSNWHQATGWFFQTAATQTEYALSTWTEAPVKFWGLWLPNLLVGFVSLLLMVYACAKRLLRVPEAAWFFVYFAVSYGATWLLSGPRYMAVFWPLAVVTEKLPLPKWSKAALLGSAALAYTVFFALRWSVW